MAVMYTYTLAVLLTGAFLQQSLGEYAAGEPSRFLLLGVGALVAVFWTLYCEWTVLDRLPGYADPQAAAPDAERPDSEEPRPGN